jgi:dTMP kinase
MRVKFMKKDSIYHVEFDLDFKRNNLPGKFIVLEGIEASGKTTQVKELGKRLPKAVITKNPTDDNEIGVFIRNKVLAGKSNLPPVAYQYLFAADRAIQQQAVIDLLKKGKTVISDRYLWSSVAYGIADRQDFDYKNWEEVTLVAYSALSMYHQFLLPDLTIYLDISLEESLKRIKGSSKHTEIYDNHKMNVKIQKGYRWLIEKFPKEFTIVDGDGNRTEEEITHEILKLIKGIKK